MSGPKDASCRSDRGLALLDDLLTRCAEKLAKEMEEKPKLGDFIKMIELRRRIAPGDVEQQNLLKLLEKARSESPVSKTAIGKSSSVKGTKKQQKKGRAV